MKLLKTSILNGVAVLIKTATMFLLNKILAIYVGPAGYAAIGQFQNFIQMIISFSGTAINTAVVKYTAEYYEDENKQRLVWKTAGSIILISSFIFSLFIIFFRKKLSFFIFHSVEYQSVFIWFSIFLIFFTLNSFFLAILNGKKEIISLVTANIVGSIISLVLTSLLTIKYNLYGALIALSIYQSIAFFSTLLICCKSKWFKLEFFFGKIEKAVAIKLASFVLMAFVSVFFGNISQIILRNIIVKEYGLNYAGYWEAMTRLSNGYLLFASTLLGVYYLPKLSELKKYLEIKKEINLGYKVILPAAIISSLLVYVFKETIVRILFTDEFMPMLELIVWQLIGDVIKIASWIISYMMLSRAMTKLFAVTEAFFALSVIPLTVVFMNIIGFSGIAFAFMLNCLLYWLVCSYYSFNKLKEIS